MDKNLVVKDKYQMQVCVSNPNMENEEGYWLDVWINIPFTKEEVIKQLKKIYPESLTSEKAYEDLLEKGSHIVGNWKEYHEYMVEGGYSPFFIEESLRLNRINEIAKIYQKAIDKYNWAFCSFVAGILYDFEHKKETELLKSNKYKWFPDKKISDVVKNEGELLKYDDTVFDIFAGTKVKIFKTKDGYYIGGKVSESQISKSVCPSVEGVLFIDNDIYSKLLKIDNEIFE
jgi:hypothetical protein